MSVIGTPINEFHPHPIKGQRLDDRNSEIQSCISTPDKGRCCSNNSTGRPYRNTSHIRREYQARSTLGLAGTREWGLNVAVGGGQGRRQEVIRSLKIEGSAMALDNQGHVLGNRLSIEDRTGRVAVRVASGRIPSKFDRSEAAGLDVVSSGRLDVAHFSLQIENDSTCHLACAVEVQAHHLRNSLKRSGAVVQNYLGNASVAARKRAIAESSSSAGNQQTDRSRS